MESVPFIIPYIIRFRIPVSQRIQTFQTLTNQENLRYRKKTPLIWGGHRTLFNSQLALLLRKMVVYHLTVDLWLK